MNGGLYGEYVTASEEGRRPQKATPAAESATKPVDYGDGVTSYVGVIYHLINIVIFMIVCDHCYSFLC